MTCMYNETCNYQYMTYYIIIIIKKGYNQAIIYL